MSARSPAPTHAVEKPPKISVFVLQIKKIPVFPAFFAVCSLRSTHPLAIVQCGPGLFVDFRGRISRLVSKTFRGALKIQEDKNTRWQPSL